MNGINILNTISSHTIRIKDSELNTSLNGILIKNITPFNTIYLTDNTIDNNGIVDYNGHALAIQEVGQFHNFRYQVLNNQITSTNNLHAVLLNNVNSLDFNNNQISIPNASVISGLQITNCNKIDVRDNHILGNSLNAYNIYESLGIDKGNDGIYGNMNNNNHFTCNYIHDLHCGMQFDNMNDKSLLIINHFSEDPAVSDGNDFKFGIHLNLNGVIGLQYNDLNIWPGSSSSNDELIHDSNDNAIFSKSLFLIDNSLSTDYKPNPYAPSSFVNFGTYPTEVDCDIAPPGVVTPDISRLDSNLVNNTFPFNDTLSFRWFSDNNLVKWVNNSRDTVSFDADLLDYVDSLSMGLNGSYIFVQDELNRILSDDTYSTVINASMERIRIIDSLLHITSNTLATISDSTTRNGYSHYVDSLQLLLHQLDSMLLNKVALAFNLRVNELDTLYDYNISLSYPSMYIQNEKLINKYIINLLRRDSIYFTSTEMDDVRDIANQCADEGGNSVYRARALRSFFESATYLFDCIPEPPAPLLNTNNKQFSDLLMFPNPASNDLTFVRKGSAEDIEIDLYDIKGTKIKNWKLSQENTQLTVLLDNIPNGLYIVKGKSLNSKHFTGLKLIVIKN